MRRMRKVMKTKLNGPSLMKAVNIWVVSVLLRHPAYFVDWTNAKLAKLDRSTRKKFNMDGGPHPSVGVARLYLFRNEFRRGSISVEV